MKFILYGFLKGVRLAGYVLIGYLAVDFSGALFWILSGQTPGDFYVGMVTANILNLIF